MKIKKIFFSILLIATVLFPACNDFLDQIPDSRTELSSPDQISLLLVDGYSNANYAMLAELSSDNFVDNNSADKDGNRYNLNPYNKVSAEVFAWEDAKSYNNDGDSPAAVWESAYHAIAVANHALEAIAQYEQDGQAEEVKAQKGEALLIRAYHHFILVNMFSMPYRNDVLSASDPGIPYVTEVGKSVFVTNSNRLSVTEVYNKIEADLLAGLPLLNDAAYGVPKYHFNVAAANAFAARFYLFKRNYPKVIEYATATLGPAPSQIMRNWNYDPATFDALANWQINAESPNNLMLIATYSTFMRYLSGRNGIRYACNREAAHATIFGEGPSWPTDTTKYNCHPCYSGKLYINGEQDYGIWSPVSPELFEYSDKVAGIGFAHIVRNEFTAEETLLCRSEAYIHLNQLDEALSDLQVWDNARKNLPFIVKFDTLTYKTIHRFYSNAKYNYIAKPLNMDKIDPQWNTIQIDSQRVMLQCALHFRRIETVFQGFRWFDIKRYGIEITHEIGLGRVETLTWDDPRRALQLPLEVIATGLDPNQRERLPVSSASYTPLKAEAYLKK